MSYPKQNPLLTSQDRYIQRANALEAAIRFSGGLAVTNKEELVEIADLFHSFLSGDAESFRGGAIQ